MVFFPFLLFKILRANFGGRVAFKAIQCRTKSRVLLYTISFLRHQLNDFLFFLPSSLQKLIGGKITEMAFATQEAAAVLGIVLHFFPFFFLVYWQMRKMRSKVRKKLADVGDFFYEKVLVGIF